MKSRFGSTPLRIAGSEILVSQIMRTLHLSRPEATAMALRMLIKELIIAAMTPSCQGLAQAQAN